MQNPPPGQQQQQGYGTPYGTPPNAPLTPPPVSDDPKGKTSLGGLEANVAAALGYPIGIIAIIMVVMEKQNRFARFHALQSLFYHVAAIVALIVVMIVGVILTIIVASINSSLGGLAAGLLWLVYMVIFLAYFGGLIFAAVKAYNGQWFKLPIVSKFAEQIANK
jgi:uncharacterized membrane protein